jgi:hypothetical protein
MLSNAIPERCEENLTYSGTRHVELARAIGSSRRAHLDHIVYLLTAVVSVACTRNNNTAPPARSVCICAATSLHTVPQRAQCGIGPVAVVLIIMLRPCASGSMKAHLNNEHKLNGTRICALDVCPPICLRMSMHALDRHDDRDAGVCFAALFTELGIGGQMRKGVSRI